MIDAGIEVLDYPNAAHHIVAGNSPKANEARIILERYGIGINDAANGVFLPIRQNIPDGVYHPSLHTQTYYDTVNNLLKAASNKETTYEILKYIGNNLANGTFDV